MLYHPANHAYQPFNSWGPFYWHGLILILAWLNEYIHYNVWDEITYPFPHLSGRTVEDCNG